MILVTHALHFLSHCDYIYTLSDGSIAEHGTYEQLVRNDGEFARLDREFGGNELQPPIDQKSQTSTYDAMEGVKLKSRVKGANINGKLIVQERRTTGSVSWKGKITCVLLSIR